MRQPTSPKGTPLRKLMHPALSILLAAGLATGLVACASGNAKADKSITQYKQTCIDAGCQIVKLDPAVVAQIREKGSVVYDMVRKDLGSEIVDQLMNAIKEAKSK